MILIIRIGLLLGIFLLSLWKIYIGNQIYLLSVQIDRDLKYYYTLQAEQRWWNSQIERIKFQNRTKELW
ncbi:MAG: hypothetical protein ABGW77_00365 [Campylobacterales bacterium]